MEIAAPNSQSSMHREPFDISYQTSEDRVSRKSHIQPDTITWLHEKLQTKIMPQFEKKLGIISKALQVKLLVYNGKKFIAKQENVDGMISRYIESREPKGHVSFDALLPFAGKRWYGEGNRGLHHEPLCAAAGWGGIFPDLYIAHLRDHQFNLNILNSGMPGTGKSTSVNVLLKHDPAKQPTLLETNMGLRNEAEGQNEYVTLIQHALKESKNPTIALVTLRAVDDTLASILKRGAEEGPEQGRTVGIKINAKHSMNSIRNTIEAFDKFSDNKRMEFGLVLNSGKENTMVIEKMSAKDAIETYKKHLITEKLWDGTMENEVLPSLKAETFEARYKEATEKKITAAKKVGKPYSDDLTNRTLNT